MANNRNLLTRVSFEFDMKLFNTGVGGVDM